VKSRAFEHSKQPGCLLILPVFGQVVQNIW